MTIKDEDLLAAISGGIDQATPGDTNAGTDTGGADDTADDEHACGDGSGEEGAEGAAGAGEGGGDDTVGEDAAADQTGEDAGDGEGDEEIDPATGKPKAKAGSEGVGEDGQPLTKEQKRAKEEAENAAAAKADPINAPISPYLKAATQERMRALVGIAKEGQRFQQERNEIIQMVQDTGASAQQFSHMLHYLQAVNSRDPVQLREAMAFLQQEIQHVSRMAGLPAPGVNSYDQHADLKAAVDAKQITPELANEIAARRDGDTYQTQSRENQTRAEQQRQQEYQQAVADGKAALNQVGAQLKTQPDYAKKAPLVLQKIAAELKTAHPSKWATIFLTAYTTFQMPAPKPAVRKAPTNQPLRGNNPSGGQQGAPKSLADAINMGIARGTRA